ncbi:MAG: hypothetical protein ACM4AI_16300 [Acidobacteriota bacterium]
MGFSVDGHGGITVAPRTFRVEKDHNDIITWMIGNQGEGPITVTFTEFMFKPDKDAAKGSVPIDPEPFIWLASDNARIEAGQVGLIAARLRPDYEFKSQGVFKHDYVSYTIEVRSTANPKKFADVDYDPDGEIKP